MKKYFLTLLFISYTFSVLVGQEITVKLEEEASLEQVYGKSQSSEQLLSMNDMDMESGYMLYSTKIQADKSKKALLQFENIRDYAVVYVNNEQTRALTSDVKSIHIELPQGESEMRVYVENIGRITYGPEILDNSRGLFGKASLDGERISNWQITPLHIRQCDVRKLDFSNNINSQVPRFYRGYFMLEKTESKHLDIMNNGMGEVWINGQYLGAYWGEEAQKSLPIPSSTLKKGKNEVVIFDIKNNESRLVRITDKPVFK